MPPRAWGPRRSGRCGRGWCLLAWLVSGSSPPMANDIRRRPLRTTARARAGVRSGEGKLTRSVHFRTPVLTNSDPTPEENAHRPREPHHGTPATKSVSKALPEANPVPVPRDNDPARVRQLGPAGLPGSGAGLEAPALVACLDDLAVVREPVEERRRHPGVAEYARPIAEGEVRCDDDRSALVEAVDDVEGRGWA